jgi:hypothetical protein
MRVRDTSSRGHDKGKGQIDDNQQLSSATSKAASQAKDCRQNRDEDKPPQR